MGKRVSAWVVVLAVLAIAGASLAPLQGLRGVGSGGDVRASLFDGPSPWNDSLDDLSHVYVPEGGLVNVEVAGGEARLTAGQDSGWIASSVITCPHGYRYDLVCLEAEQPGSSRVEISTLNASKEAGELGFANETIPPHVRVRATDEVVYDISPSINPALRIQVNLVADGPDRPRLLAWSLYYVPMDEWRDDFLGKGKMRAMKGINVTSGQTELNLSKTSTEEDDYTLFPTVATCNNDGLKVFYPNGAGDGYQDSSTLYTTAATGVSIGDIDGDGFYDLVAAIGTERLAKIFWGDSSGRWSESRFMSLAVRDVYRVVIGDFNCDGKKDVACACWNNSGDATSFIWFRSGSRSFQFGSNQTFSGKEYYGATTGDLNGDGRDDLVFADDNGLYLYYGSPIVDDLITLDRTYPVAVEGGLEVYDVNCDEYMDILIGGTVGGKIPIYLGGPDGPDTTPDYLLEYPSSTSMSDIGAGDINGDGYVDIVALSFQNMNTGILHVYEGAVDGWSYARSHTIISSGFGKMRVIDVNKDGFDDIVLSSWDGTSASMKCIYGGASWPTTADFVKPNAGHFKIAVAAPRQVNSKYFRGSFTTLPIVIGPDQRWDSLLIESTIPKDTSIHVSVLGYNGVVLPGFGGLSSQDIDLSSILSENTIMLKMDMFSPTNSTTPSIDSISVRWMQRGTWRERFYGSARVERVLGLEVSDGQLLPSAASGAGPQLLVPSLRGQTGYGVRPEAFFDGGGLDYGALPPIPFEANGVSAVDAADVNGDGFMDVAFAVRQTGDTDYGCQSPLFLGSAVGWRTAPDFSIPTTGASDVLLRDLNGDGNVDVVFAQEYDGTSYRINSTLFWGKAGGGWNATADVQFETSGASGVAAEDLDGDGDLDLAFACFRDATSTSTNSMVFLQDAAGFCGTVPSYKLPTRGARGVATGDVNGDGRLDLALANSVSGGSAEIDSYIYMGKAGGGFVAAATALRTSGARDVELADLDGDGDLDAVFANMRDNLPSYKVDSCVYLNDGTGAFPASPSARLPTTGAVAVAVADLDGTGRKDLVFACQYDGTSHNVSSVVYMGGAIGWSASPDITIPTVGASDVLVAYLIKAGHGGYMSRPITPEEPSKTGTFHTFRYTASLGASQSGRLMLVDAVTWDVLAETALQDGTNEWTVADLFWVKEHPSIRAVVTVSGLDRPGAFTLDDLWLNWTKRVMRSPVVEDLGLSSTSIYRMRSGTIWINVTDEYDPINQLNVVLEHRLTGATGAWTTYLINKSSYFNGSWRATVFPRADAATGSYDLRVNVTDSDGMFSGYMVFPSALTVLNGVPTTPVIRIDPANPVTTSTLVAVVITPATDIETSALIYHYRWFKDGELQAAIVTDTVISSLTTKGENWSVEVSAYDGSDEGPPAMASMVIGNAGPMVKRQLPNPELMEDTPDNQWIDLAGAFEDPDGDSLAWTVSPTPQNITVTIDPATGKVTLTPEASWNGEESITFVASDGQAQASQTILVTVTAVNDRPWFTTVNNQPITADPVAFRIMQGETLTIVPGAMDIEGDTLIFSVNSSSVQLDEDTGTITFQAGNEAVGTLRFALTMWDNVSTSARVKLNIVIVVENKNDPMEVPRITSPHSGAKFKVDQLFSLVGACTDPDTIYGQVLNFSWYANGTLLGYGMSLTINFTQPGTYIINLTVTDGEFTRGTEVPIVIEAKEIPMPPPPPPNGDGGEKGISYGLIVGVIVIIAVAALLAFLLVTRRRAARLEAKDETEEKHEDIKRMAAEVKATADEMEREMAVTKATAPKPAEPTKVVIETQGPDGQVVVSTTGAPEQQLTVQPMETETPSAEVAQLFKDVETKEARLPSADAEALRIENLKRKYQTAIGRLPYGIPATELKGRDWNELAAALATGERKTLLDGREVTLIEGRWYFSDVKDASSFLKEHGTRPKAGTKKAAAVPSMDRTTILAKLEERLAMGEISEETYKQLRRKYEG
jgi:uncharacterized membrane protein